VTRAEVPAAAPEVSEDTEEQSDLRSRSAISLVAGHLEGYADAIDLIVRDDLQLHAAALASKLREDAKKLRQSGGGEGS